MSKKVILIMTDTTRTDMLGCYGNPGMITPNLDQLAADGIRFEQAYTTQPVCQPARSAIFTGTYPHSCAGWSNCMGLSDNVQNIGRRLSDHGIHSAYIGKWHLDGGDYFGLGRCADGWDPDYWYDMRNYLDELTPEERYLSRQTHSMETHDIKAEFTFGHRCSDKAIDFLQKHHDLDDDYFLVVSYDEIGRVLKAVNDYASDAVVIYTSDHGDMLYSHSLTAKGPAMYEEITHIPFIVRGFGRNQVDPNPVSHINLAPTLCDIFGVPKPKVFERKSIYEELKTGQRTNDYVFMEFGRYEVDHDGFGGYQPVRCVFDGRYKLVINLMTSDELYDLQNDPFELKTRILDASLDAEKKRLHEALLDNMYETRDPFRGYYWENRPWNSYPADKTWNSRLMTRQRENEEYEPRQLDYNTGLAMKEATRKKGQCISE